MLGDSWAATADGQETYVNAIAQSDPTLAQTLRNAQSTGEDWTMAALRLLNTYTMADSQRKLLQIQMQRANQGLPPLNSSQYGLGATVGLSPDTMKFAGFALAGLALFMFLNKRVKGG